MNKGFTGNYLLTGLVALVLIGGVFYLGRISNQNQTQTSSPTQATPAPTSSGAGSALADETANWKTYTEETYKFVVKYPASWIVTPFDYKKFPVANSDQPQAIVSFKNKFYEGMELGTPGLIDVGITYIKPKVSFADFLAQGKTVSNKSPNKPVGINDEIINVDGIQSRKVTYQYNEFTNTMVYVPKNESVYIIRSQALNKDIVLNSEFLSQILSTFKFF